MEPSAQTRATACDVTGTVNSIDCETDAPAGREGARAPPPTVDGPYRRALMPLSGSYASARLPTLIDMVSFIKSVTFDCQEPLLVAAFWARALGSNVDEDSTQERAWVEAAGWGGPSLWFVRVPEPKVAKNRQHFDLRPTGSHADEVGRLITLGASVLRDDGDLTVMIDPEGNEFCVE